MEILLSATAFFIALTAVWYASQATKKMDAYFKDFFESNIKSIRKELGNNSNTLTGLETRLHKIENDKSTKTEQKDLQGKIESLQNGMKELQDSMKKLNKKMPNGFK